MEHDCIKHVRGPYMHVQSLSFDLLTNEINVELFFDLRLSPSLMRKQQREEPLDSNKKVPSIDSSLIKIELRVPL